MQYVKEETNICICLEMPMGKFGDDVMNIPSWDVDHV